MKTVRIERGGGERAFMSGVLILTASTVIVKIIGLAYKIPLISLMGAEGMGYFNSAYEIYALLCGVSTSGLPIAVSMLIASADGKGDTARAAGIFKTSSALLLTKGVLMSASLALFAKPIADAIGNADAYYAILAISPALLFSCVSGAVRGYFQGHRLMMPTAISQLSEALGKLVFGVAFAALALAMGFSVAAVAAFAVMGVSVGSLISASFLVIRKWTQAGRERARSAGNAVGYFWELSKISIPITLGSALMGSTRMIDMALIMQRLQTIGVSAAEANRIYGSYTTLALPVYSLVPAFIPPITESLIPRLSAAVTSRIVEEQRRAVSNAMRLTLFLAVPSSMGITLYSKEIISLLFSSQSEAIEISAPLLSALGASVLLSCVITTSTAVLQAYKKVLAPIISLAAGAVVKAVSAYAFIGLPDVREMGAPISTMLFNLTVLCLDIAFMYRAIPKKTGAFGALPKCLFSSLVAMAASYAVFLPIDRATDSTVLSFGAGLCVAVGVYFALACLMGVVGKDDIEVLKLKRK